MSFSLCSNHFGRNNLISFHFINFECFCMSKVLEYISVVISYCYFHCHHSFSSSSFCLLLQQQACPCGYCTLKFPPAMIKTFAFTKASRSEEHTSELQSRQYLVCR